MWELRGQVVKGWNSAKMGDIPSTWITVNPTTCCPPTRARNLGGHDSFKQPCG